MKKYYLILCAALTLAACVKEEPKNEMPQVRLEFDVTVTQDAPTKAVKTDFVSGDVIYAFFNNVAVNATPKYATLTYDGTKWSGALQGGLAVGELAASGETMSAVYFPFGTVNITKSGDTYAFKGADNLPIYSYFSSATASYELATAGEIATLTATLNMTIPDNYVQFFVDKSGSDYASDGKYRLAVKDIRPAACGSYTPAGGFAITALDYSQPMWGYVYDDLGVLFSGQIDATAWSSASERRFIFFETGAPAKSATISKTLASHASVKLTNVASWPAAVTVPTTVDMGIYKNNNPATGKTLLWADRNLGAQAAASFANNNQDYGFLFAWGEIVPYFEADGWQASWEMKPDMTQAKYYWYDSVAGSYSKYTTPGDVLETQDDAASAYLGNGWRMPTKEELAALWGLEYTQHIEKGYTVNSNLYFPNAGRRVGSATSGRTYYNNYWSSTIQSAALGWYNYGAGVTSENGERYTGMSVRPVKEVQAISNLVHYWPFNGNTNDAVGAINAVNTGATLTTDRFGNANSAYSFDGDDIMTIGSAGNFGSSSFTASMWISTTANSSLNTLIRTEEGGGGNGWFIWFDNNGIEIWASSKNYVSSAKINDGAWHMITFVQDADNKVGQLYIDGAYIGGYSMETVPSVSNGNTHVLGSGMTTPYCTFVGKMDEVRLYDKALTAAEVAALYQY